MARKTPRKPWTAHLSTVSAVTVLVAGAVFVVPVVGQQAQSPAGLQRPVYRVSQGAAAAPAGDASSNGTAAKTEKPSSTELAESLQPREGEHPLAPAIRIAKAALERIDRDLTDYSATLVKRERIGDSLGEREFIFTKIRQQPFSVYMYFLGPEALKAQECLYVANQNDGNLLGHAGSGLRARFGTVSLKPDGMLAMQGQRYPVTEVGIRNLTRRLIEVGEQDMQYGECEVKNFLNTTVDGRKCTCIQVTHPVPRKNFLFNVARIFIDNELMLPIRYEAYSWPREAGKAVGEDELIEEYTYTNLKLNNSFTDADFAPNNPKYRFSK